MKRFPAVISWGLIGEGIFAFSALILLIVWLFTGHHT